MYAAFMRLNSYFTQYKTYPELIGHLSVFLIQGNTLYSDTCPWTASMQIPFELLLVFYILSLQQCTTEQMNLQQGL